MRNRDDDTTKDMGFLYTEEIGLSLMMNRRTGKKLGMEKEMWEDLQRSIRSGSHPGVKDS